MKLRQFVILNQNKDAIDTIEAGDREEAYEMMTILYPDVFLFDTYVYCLQENDYVSK